MKMITLEHAKKMTFFASLALLTAHEMIPDNEILLYTLQGFSDIYLCESLSSSYIEKLTKEYKEMKEIYCEIIKNTVKLYNDIGSNDPVSIFATYIYMYRSGLFSYNKTFRFSGNTKDFADLSGVDIIRGKGVCRSISSMLTDIYNAMGFAGQDLCVRAIFDNMENVSDNYPVKLLGETTVNNDTMLKIADKVKLLANHQINMVQQNNYNYILDPTNNLFLMNQGNKLVLANDDSNYMKIDIFTNLFLKVAFGHTNQFTVINDQKKLLMKTISHDEYTALHLKAVQFCLKNNLLFEEFFSNNSNLINDLYLISEQQHSLMKRKNPFLRIK